MGNRVETHSICARFSSVRGRWALGGNVHSLLTNQKFSGMTTGVARTAGIIGASGGCVGALRVQPRVSLAGSTVAATTPAHTVGDDTVLMAASSPLPPSQVFDSEALASHLATAIGGLQDSIAAVTGCVS